MIRLLLALLFLAAPAAASAQAQPPAAFRSDRIVVETRGPAGGPDILFIPGLGSTSSAWGTTARQLQTRYRVHLISLRGFGETRYNGNSIFVFDLADLCIAHLGHLHHTLTEADLAELGSIDIVLVPVDGSFTLNQPEMIEVLRQLKAKIAIPMHVFTEETLARFLARAAERGYGVRHAAEPRITVSRSDLPAEPEILVLSGR